MRNRNLVRKTWRLLAGGLAATTLATSCSTAELNFARQGLDAIIQTRQDNNQNNGSFLDLVSNGARELDSLINRP